MSHCLLSKKGPLGIIWTAAHCRKKLKKEQIFQTDISSSVDKILLDEVPVVTYRILAYLLLGLARIYSKKVEYLFHDCRDVLSELRHFVISKKSNTPIEVIWAPNSSITVPERFELDTFDLEVIENASGDCMTPREGITQKGKKEGIWLQPFEQYHFEEDAQHFEGFSAGHTPIKDIYSPYPTTVDLVASTLHNLSNLEGRMKKFHNNRFLLEECLPPMLFDEAEEAADPGRTFHEEHQINGGEVKSSHSPMLIGGDDAEPEDYVKSFDEEHANLEQTKFSELTVLESEKAEAAYPGRTFHEEHQTNGEEVKSLHSPMMIGDDAVPEDYVKSFGEEHANMEQTKFSELTALESEKIHISSQKRPVSVSINVTPELKASNAAGASTAEFMAVRTPATKEGASDKVLKKRKCLYDEMILIPSKVYKEGIDDSSDLVKKRRKRRKALHAALLSNKANQMSDIPNIFLEPLIPCVSINFRSLICEKKQKTPEPIEVVETPTKIDELGSLAIDRPQEEEEAIAPSTPVTHSTSLRFNDIRGVTNSERVGPVSSFESIGKDPSLSEDREFDIILMNEELNSCEGDCGEKNNWSARTRAVARYLHKKFLSRKKSEADEIVNLSQVLEGKTKKESARLFYELLVLKTGGFVNVRQDNSYDDLSVLETGKLKQACEADGTWGR